ncbi:hypothetical protein LG288_03145 [Idiomarina seosinensis]|uniref:hypothetical protein n=1 Tax=Idiomarina seosinensis TaxID=281739 RepID=UPI00384EFD87
MNFSDLFEYFLFGLRPRFCVPLGGFVSLRDGFVCAARKVLLPAGGFVSLRDGFVCAARKVLFPAGGFGGLRPGFTAAKPPITYPKIRPKLHTTISH